MGLGDLLTSPKEKIVFNGPFIADQYSGVRLTNGDATTRVGYRIRPLDPLRVGVKPTQGLLNANEHVDVRVDYRKFLFDPNFKYEDRLLIEWAAVPDGVNEFNASWFDASLTTRRLNLPISHNV